MSAHVHPEANGSLKGLAKRAIVWITLSCFVLTHATAQVGPHAEGTAAGQAANPFARGNINAPDASTVVPGYTTTPPERLYHGQPNLSGQTSARLAACATTPNDPVCQALLGARASANTPREAISPYDPAVSAARAIAANPATTLEDIATYYSGCLVDSVATPTTENRICRQYSGTSPYSCTRSLSVSVLRTSSCTPGNWFAHAASGRTGLDVQCIPDRPASQQHFRVTDRGTPLAYFDLDMTTPLTFPRMVATLPRSGSWWWWGSGQNGLWVADNQCVGDSCRLTAMVALEYRRVCTDGGGDSGLGDCALERPFLEVYGACPSGTQSGDNILPWWGWGGDISAFEASACYAPSATASAAFWDSSQPPLSTGLAVPVGGSAAFTSGYFRPVSDSSRQKPAFTRLFHCG